MTETGKSLQHDLLDLLVDGAASFAALYGGLVHWCGYSTGFEVSLVMDTLLEMERRGEVKAWQMAEDGSFHEPTDEERNRASFEYRAWLLGAEIAQLGVERLAVDEVGLWYELTAEGRVEWKRWTVNHEERHRRRWVLDDLGDTQTIVVRAETVEAAEETLQWWLLSNPRIELVGSSRSIESIPGFKLRDGTMISSGVKLTCEYRRAGS